MIDPPRARKGIFFIALLLGIFCCIFVSNENSTDYGRSAGGFKVMTYNAGDFATPLDTISIESFASIIRNEYPDVVLLQEVYEVKSCRVEELLSSYNMVSLPSSDTLQHIRILARREMKFVGSKKLRGYDGFGDNIVCVEVTTNKGPLLICSVYLTSLRSELTHDEMGNKISLVRAFFEEILYESKRSREAEELLVWLNSLNYEYIVIGGDFNSLTLSKAIGRIRKKFNDSASGKVAFWQSSHKSNRFYLPVKVDYIFLSKNLSCSGTKMIPQSPGDHYPVVTNIAELHVEN